MRSWRVAGADTVTLSESDATVLEGASAQPAWHGIEVPQVQCLHAHDALT